MSVIVWDNVGDRVFETGLDRGVLYLPDGSAVPWNGLVSVIESSDKATSSVYYDGMKINDLVVLGDFAATMKAVTYPNEFLDLEGLVSTRPGVLLADQPPKLFGLSYRTQIGNDLDGDGVGYKIHILYNLMAIPSQKTYATVTTNPSLVEFEWKLTAIPEEFPGIRPTAHIILDSREVDPWLLEELEGMLYGIGSDASLIPMPDLLTLMRDWFRVKIVDNGDGTWTATADRDGFINFTDGGLTVFELVGVNAVYLTDDTYQLSDTMDVSDVPQIKITYNPDGTWTASTDHDDLIVMTGPYSFEIRNANVIFLTADTYKIEDTTSSN